jgi:hypothetical protein
MYYAAALWLLLFTGIGLHFLIGATKQLQKDKDFLKRRIDPGIATIDSFKTIHARLPSVKEFEKIKNGSASNLGSQNYIRNLSDVDAEIKSKVKDMDWSDNYVLAVWRGEWWEYYISRNHVYVTNGYSIADGWIAMVAALIVGALPLIGLVFHRMHRKKLLSISH